MQQQFDELPKKLQDTIKSSFTTFKVSFIIGTVIFLVYISQPDGRNNTTLFDLILFLIGIFYIVSAFIVNIFFFIDLFFAAIDNKKYSRLLFKYAAIMLINIPVAAIYFYVIIAIPHFL